MSSQIVAMSNGQTKELRSNAQQSKTRERGKTQRERTQSTEHRAQSTEHRQRATYGCGSQCTWPCRKIISDSARVAVSQTEASEKPIEALMGRKRRRERRSEGGVKER